MRESEKHVNYASKARNYLHMGARRQKDTFFLILVVVSCERMRESEKHVNYASKARNLHMGARRQKDTFFLILVVVSCERIIRKNVTRVTHNVIRFLGFIWILFGVSFSSRVYAKLDFSLSILCF